MYNIEPENLGGASAPKAPQAPGVYTHEIATVTALISVHHIL